MIKWAKLSCIIQNEWTHTIHTYMYHIACAWEAKYTYSIDGERVRVKMSKTSSVARCNCQYSSSTDHGYC